MISYISEEINGKFNTQAKSYYPGLFKVELVIEVRYVTCPKTFSEKSPIFEELVAVFSNIIQQERDFVAGELFASSYVWNDRPSFCRKKK